MRVIECNVCGEALSGLTGSMKMVKFDVGSEFDVITVSFNPQETPAIAAAKKQDYLKRYGRTGAASGWHFLTGDQKALDRLTELNERQAQVMTLRYFGGMTVEETAEALAIAPRTVKREWALAKAWLRVEIASKVVR